MTQRRVRQFRRGFTLIETLVALALMALLAGFLSGGVVFGRRAWERSVLGDKTIEIDAARTAIADLLERAVPLMTGGNEPLIVFDGQSASIMLIVRGEFTVENAGLRRITLELKPLGTGQALIISSGPTISQSGEALTTRTLVENVTSLAIRYYGALTPDAAAVWHSTWRNALRLPLLVEINVKLSGKDRQQLIPLVVHIKG